MLFSDSWSTQLLAVIFFFLIHVVIYWQYFESILVEEKSHIISDDLEIMLNEAIYSGEKNAAFLVAPLGIQRQSLFEIVAIKYPAYLI